MPLIEGRVIPFLGVGVNRCGRPTGEAWGPSRYLPDGGELTKHLIATAGDPADEPQDLLRVSQYVAVMSDTGPLYGELRRLLKADYSITGVHCFLDGLPALMHAKGFP